MNFPTTQLEATVDLARTDAGCLVIVRITDREGRELHKLISEPKDDESANYAIGGQLGALERLGIVAGPTEAARELQAWWETDRVVLVYMRYFNRETDEFPTLERAFSAAEGMSESGSGAPDEIQEVGTGRTLYKMGRNFDWERVADDVPAVDEFTINA